MLSSKTFFPNLIAAPFDAGLRIAFSISVALALIAALASLLRGKRYIYEQENQVEPGPAEQLRQPSPVAEEAILEK